MNQIEPSIEQIRSFRLHSHHLDRMYERSDIAEIAGACGLQNSPPGAWETALYNRVPGMRVEEMESLLYEKKVLLQAWSLRGAPVVFPAKESNAFLAGLAAQGEEPWIYTRGITLALDFLGMTFEELFEILMQVMPRLDGKRIVSKVTLDQTIADWMAPLLPGEKRKLWAQPSMYGSPDKQSVGGAVVSFMLRPCAFLGLVVFGEREGISPTFTSYQSWTGQELVYDEESPRKQVRKFLHCYGPANVDAFIGWLGCSGKQGRRMWNSVSGEMETVMSNGKKASILSADSENLFSPPAFGRELLLLGGHDPYLDQRDRLVLQPDKSLHKHIWKTVSNPGAICFHGEIIGTWTSKKKGRGMEINLSLWNDAAAESRLRSLAEDYTAFRRQELVKVEISVDNGR